MGDFEVRQFESNGLRGVGTRDWVNWAARVSLRGERGCASEPVAREGWPEHVILEFLLEYRWSGDVSQFWNILWNIEGPAGIYIRQECRRILDVTPRLLVMMKTFVSFQASSKLLNSSNRV